MIECMNCKKLTNNPKFCSQSCAATINNNMFPKRKTIKICTKCNNTTAHYRTRLCQFHIDMRNNKSKLKQDKIKNKETRINIKKDEIMNLTLESLINHGYSDRNKYTKVRHYARKYFGYLLSFPCKVCGYSKHVQLCHVIPIHKFDLSCKLFEINNESNLIQLCPNCHWELDNNLLK